MKIEETITIAALATFFSSIVSSIVGYYLAKFNSVRNEERFLDGLLIQINTLNIQYPYLENEKFINKYKKKKKKNEEYSRYDSYCTIVFNFLERVFVLYNFNLNKVNNFVHYRELIETHSRWWNHPDNYHENMKGYNQKFVVIVTEIIANENCRSFK
jgi:hypothetical protein